MSYNNYKVWDYGDLRVTLTKDYGWTYDDTGSGAGSDLSTYAVYGSATMRPLGHIASRSIADNVTGKRATLLVGANPNASPAKPAVAAPTGFTKIKDIIGSKHRAVIWRATPPSGYRECGDIVIYGTTDKPGVNNFWCLREDLTVRGNYQATSVWWNGGLQDLSIWDIVPDSSVMDGGSQIPIHAGTFRAARAREKPDVNIAYVPALTLPDRLERFSAKMPSFTKATKPRTGDTFGIAEEGNVVLPFIAFLPNTDIRSLDKISNPFLKVSRAAAWFVETVWDNDTNGTAEKTKTVTKGFSKSQSTEMTNSAGVTISAEYGIKGASFGISMNYQFTLTNSTSFTEYQEVQDSVKYNVQPWTCVVVLSQHVYFKGERQDGTATLSAVNTALNEELHYTSFDLK